MPMSSSEITSMIRRLRLACRDRIAKKTYIRAAAYPQPHFDKALAKCKAEGWRTFELPGDAAGHDVMVDAPQRLAEILMQVA